MDAPGVPSRVELRVGSAAEQIVLAAHRSAGVIVAGRAPRPVTPWQGPKTLEEELRVVRVPVLAVPSLRPASGSVSMLAGPATEGQQRMRLERRPPTP